MSRQRSLVANFVVWFNFMVLFLLLALHNTIFPSLECYKMLVEEGAKWIVKIKYYNSWKEKLNPIKQFFVCNILGLLRY